MKKTRRLIEAVPRKKILREKADAVSVKQCIAELVDNCIDYWIFRYRSTKPRPRIEIEMNIERDTSSSREPRPIKSFEMKWNMPIPEDRLEDLVTLGSEPIDQEGIIGLWGQGAKIAMHGLAHGWSLETSDGKKKITIHCPKDWINQETNWNLYADEERATEKKDLTIFRTDVLHPDKWREEKLDEEYYDENANVITEELIMNHLSSRYRLFGKIGLRLLINGDKIDLIPVTGKKSLVRDYLWMPGFEPHVDDWGSVRLPNGRQIKIKIFVGMHRIANRQEAGVYIYGNNRMFLKAAKGAPIWKSYAPKDVNMRIHVFLEGLSRDIPWGIPEKDGLTDTHFTIPFVARYVRQSAEPYSKIVKLKTEDRALYSLVGDVQKLVEKAGYEGEDAQVMKALMSNLRELNENKLQFYSESRARGARYVTECLRKDFRSEIHHLMDRAKQEDDYLIFHLGLAEKALRNKLLLKGIDRLPPKAEEPKKEKEAPTTPDPPDSSTRKATEVTGPKELTQTTLDNFDSSLDKLGDAIGIQDKNIVASKVTKAVSKMAKRLSKEGYETVEIRMIKRLLDVE